MPHKSGLYTPTQSGNLPQSHSISPHIRGTGKLPVDYGFNSHPFPRQLSLAGLHVDRIFDFYNSGHTKVRDLQLLAFSHKNVATGQITVHNVKTRNVLLQKVVMQNSKDQTNTELKNILNMPGSCMQSK